MSEQLYKTALMYVNLGYYIFPCRERPSEPFTDKKSGRERIMSEKMPYTFHGLNDSTMDVTEVRYWWTRDCPDACIGIDAGRSGLFCVDLDNKDGKNGLGHWMSLGINWEGALMSQTPSGGIHIVFSSSRKGKTTSSVTGIDTRGEGGFFIAPPSRILVGKTIGEYIALNDWSKRPVEAPKELFDKLDVNKEPKHKTPKKKVREPLSHSEEVLKAKKYLDKLASWRCDSYQDWLAVGMSLYNLGSDGLWLWDEWSRKSDHYEDGVCERKWSTFKPDGLGIASLVYWAKEDK